MPEMKLRLYSAVDRSFESDATETLAEYAIKATLSFLRQCTRLLLSSMQ